MLNVIFFHHIHNIWYSDDVSPHISHPSDPLYPLYPVNDVLYIKKFVQSNKIWFFAKKMTKTKNMTLISPRVYDTYFLPSGGVNFFHWLFNDVQRDARGFYRVSSEEHPQIINEKNSRPSTRVATSRYEQSYTQGEWLETSFFRVDFSYWSKIVMQMEALTLERWRRETRGGMGRDFLLRLFQGNPEDDPNKKSRLIPRAVPCVHGRSYINGIFERHHFPKDFCHLPVITAKIAICHQ